MSKRVAMIGLDACDLELVYQWAKEGHLPTFSRLIDTSATMNITSSTSVLQGSIWPTFFTSVTPAEHGMYYMLQMDNKTQNIKRVKANDLKKEPFWACLRDEKKCLIIDVPKLGLTESGDNAQVVEWAAMDHYSSFQTYPSNIRSQVLAEFGEHILTSDLVEPSSQLDYKDIFTKLNKGISTKAKLNLSLFGKYRPDLFVTVFGETHTAGHYLWRYHNNPDVLSKSNFESNPLLEIYKTVDSSLQKMLTNFDDEQNVFVFSGHGMMDDHYPRFILNEVLTRLGVLVSSQKSASDQHSTPALRAKEQRSNLTVLKANLKKFVNQYLLPSSIQTKLWMRNLQKHVDFTQSKAWVLPTDLQGFIRLNLQGREPLGLVPQDKYDETIEQITNCLLSLKNADTGEPVVDKIYKIRDIYAGGSHTDLLPDISVLWKNQPISSIHSDIIGEIEVGDFGIERSGNHRPRGFCMAFGPDIDASQKNIDIDLMDLGPTVLKLMGKQDATLNGNVAKILK